MPKNKNKLFMLKGIEKRFQIRMKLIIITLAVTSLTTINLKIHLLICECLLTRNYLLYFLQPVKNNKYVLGKKISLNFNRIQMFDNKVMIMYQISKTEY